MANTLQLLGVIERVVDPGVPGDPTRPEFEIKRLHLSNLVDFARSPAAYLEKLYGWGTATFDGERLFSQLEDFFSRSGLPVVLLPATATDPLRLRVAVRAAPGREPLTAWTVALARDANRGGLLRDVPLGHEAWTLQVTTAGQFERRTHRLNPAAAELTLLPPEGTLDGAAPLEDRRAAPRIGSAAGAARRRRIEPRGGEAGRGVARNALRVGRHASGRRDRRRRSGRGGAWSSTPPKETAFSTRCSASEEARPRSELRAFWSASSGLRFEGSSALEIAIPVHAAVGSVELTGLVIRSAPARGSDPCRSIGQLPRTSSAR